MSLLALESVYVLLFVFVYFKSNQKCKSKIDFSFCSGQLYVSWNLLNHSIDLFINFLTNFNLLVPLPFT